MVPGFEDEFGSEDELPENYFDDIDEIENDDESEQSLEDDEL